MKLRYCRHCKKDVPMFEANEFGELVNIYNQCVETIKQYRQNENTMLSETPLTFFYQPFSFKYKELTGLEMEYSVEEIMQRHFLKRWQDPQFENN